MSSPGGDHVMGGVQAGALRMVNAIPEICRRGPGLVSTLDLPYTPSTNVNQAFHEDAAVKSDSE